MKIIFTIILSSFFLSSYSQIISPDTVCIGSPVNFSTDTYATAYIWDFNSISVVQPVSTVTTIFSSSVLNSPGIGCLNYDSGNYYYFAPNYGTQEIIRIDFGNNIHNTPTVTDLGTCGMTSGDLDALDVVKDSATNQWYGLAVNWNQMVVLSFGTSLSNTPTTTVTTYPSIVWGHQITIKRYNGNWIAFLSNRNSNMTRFDFGSSLTNVPVVTDIPNVGGLTNPSSFTIYQQSGNWYMLIPSLISGNLTRYDFGTNLLNNSPTGTSLGNPGGLFNLPRPINLLNDCQGHLIAYVGDEGGELIKLDFAGDITNSPIATDMGSTGISHFAGASPVSYSDSFGFICADANLNKLWIYNPLYFTIPDTANYYYPNQTYTFSSPGIYHVTLFCNLGYTTGPYVFCKDIVVIPGSGTSTSRDTALCFSSTFTLYADTGASHIWNTGDTTASILADTSGTYWVTTITGPCEYKSDTVHVNFITGGDISLGDDTAFCMGNTLVLNPSVPAGSSLTWSTGSIASSISVSTSGTYWVSVSSGACTGSDTINVVVSPVPPVNLGDDTSVCIGSPFTLQSSDSYTSPSYLWNTGSTAATISPITAGDYWLAVTIAGCTGADTINVSFKNDPVVSLGDDTVFCMGSSITIGAAGPDGATYLWSTGNTTATIQATVAGIYWETVTINGCSTTDSISITNINVPSVSLGPDTILCTGDVFSLSVAPMTAVWSNDVYASSIIVSQTGIYWARVSNICGNATDSVDVNFDPCDIWFPTAFTPNDDGLNDVAKVGGTLGKFTDFSLSIYNRWGQRVFYTENIYTGWDGRFNGVKQDLGTFYYMIYYTLEGKQHMMKGDLALIK